MVTGVGLQATLVERPEAVSGHRDGGRKRQRRSKERRGVRGEDCSMSSPGRAQSTIFSRTLPRHDEQRSKGSNRQEPAGKGNAGGHPSRDGAKNEARCNRGQFDHWLTFEAERIGETDHGVEADHEDQRPPGDEPGRNQSQGHEQCRGGYCMSPREGATGDRTGPLVRVQAIGFGIHCIVQQIDAGSHRTKDSEGG